MPLTSNKIVKLIIIWSLGDESLSFPSKTSIDPLIHKKWPNMEIKGRLFPHHYPVSMNSRRKGDSICEKGLGAREAH